MRNKYLILLIFTMALACSKRVEHQPVAEDPKVTPEAAPDPVTGNSVVPGKLDSIIIGSWKYLGKSMDYPPHYAPAQSNDSGVLTFNDHLAYTEIRRGNIIDSGKYRVLDTTYSGGNPIRMLYLEPKMNLRYKGYWVLSVRNDSLTYGGGFGGSYYKRM